MPVNVVVASIFAMVIAILYGWTFDFSAPPTHGVQVHVIEAGLTR